MLRSLLSRYAFVAVTLALSGVPAAATESLTMGQDRYAVEWIAREDFSGPDWTGRWALEGNSDVEARDRRLRIESNVPVRVTAPAGVTLDKE